MVRQKIIVRFHFLRTIQLKIIHGRISLRYSNLLYRKPTSYLSYPLLIKATPHNGPCYLKDKAHVGNRLCLPDANLIIPRTESETIINRYRIPAALALLHSVMIVFITVEAVS